MTPVLISLQGDVTFLYAWYHLITKKMLRCCGNFGIIYTTVQ